MLKKSKTDHSNLYLLNIVMLKLGIKFVLKC